MKLKDLQALVYELHGLIKKVDIYCKSDEYVYSNIYRRWINEYNSLLQKYNILEDLKLNLMKCSEYDLSSTQKTAKNSAVQYFIHTMNDLATKIDEEIENEVLKAEDSQIPDHQMRQCFKLGIERCPMDPPFKRNRVFIAMPFDNTYFDSYQYGIIPALNSLGFEHYRADEEITTKDIMCKICNQIQSCGLVIINISGLNPNVMLEQGMAYGLGKSVIIKDKTTNAISDIGCLEYIEYEHAHDLMQKLCIALQK